MSGISVEPGLPKTWVMPSSRRMSMRTSRARRVIGLFPLFASHSTRVRGSENAAQVLDPTIDCPDRGRRLGRQVLHGLWRRASGQAIIFGAETLVRLASVLIAGKFRLQAIEEKHLVRTLMLRFDATARLEIK